MRKEIEILSDELERMRRILLNEVGDYNDAIADQMKKMDSSEGTTEYEEFEEAGEDEMEEMDPDIDPVTSRQVNDCAEDHNSPGIGGNPLFGLASVPEDQKENDITTDEAVVIPSK